VTIDDLRPAIADVDPRARILAAAERAFAQHGFHATTMQDVANEAGMSPGNLYRYFRSKDAIVAGLCSQDQAELAADFRALANSDDIAGAMDLMLRKHLIEKPRAAIQLVVEIWAEATRNPEIAAMCSGVDSELRSGLKQVVIGAKRRGIAAPDLDEDFAARAIVTIGAGLFKRRAIESHFDGEAEVALALGLIAAVFRGEASVGAGASGEGSR